MNELTFDIFIDCFLLALIHIAIKGTSQSGKEGVFFKRLVMIKYIVILRILYLLYKIFF